MDGITDRNQVGIRCYPISDEQLKADVHAIVQAWSDGDLTATSLGSRLLLAYPAIKVVEQEPLAALGGRLVFYIYRDGHL